MSRFFSNRFSSLVPYVPGEQPQDRKYIKLNTNESPFPPSPKAVQYASKASEGLQLYSDPEVKKLISTACDRLGVEAGNILFTNGSDEALNFAFMAFADEEHPAVFADITYGFYSVFAELNRIPYRIIPLKDDFTINPDDYIGCGGTVFIANPNAPTGIALPLSEIERIVSSNKDNIVVVDEAYVDFGGESAIKLTEKYDNLLVVQTFSKSRSMAGARLGFAVGCKELIDDLKTIKYSTNPYNVNSMTMWAGIGALEDEDYFKANCETIKKTREWTENELSKLGFVHTQSKTNFIFAKSNKIGGKELYLKLKENGILVRHFETPRLKDYNRITVGSEAEMKKFIDTVTKILDGEE